MRSPAVYDPATRQELERKQDRVRDVSRLSDSAPEGSQETYDGDLYIFRGGRWESPTKPLKDRITALEAALAKEESLSAELRDRVFADSIERERQRQENNLDAVVAFQSANSIEVEDNIVSQNEFRELSDLEEALIDFSFCGTFEADEVEIRYPYYAYWEGKPYAGLYYPDIARIEIGTAYNRYADNINADSTAANTDLTKSQNIYLFRTIVHELTHHWQYKYGLTGDSTSDGIYDYTAEELDDPSSMGLEQVASAVEDWFVIAWQIEHTPDGAEINLTGDRYWNRTQSDRFDKIREIPHVDTDVPFDDGHATVNVPQRIVTEAKAEELLGYFDKLRVWLCAQRSPSLRHRVVNPIVRN